MEVVIIFGLFLVWKILMYKGINKFSDYQVEKLIQAEEKKQDKQDKQDSPKELFIGQKPKATKSVKKDNNIIGKIFVGALILLALYLVLNFGSGSGFCGGGVTSYDC